MSFVVLLHEDAGLVRVVTSDRLIMFGEFDTVTSSVRWVSVADRAEALTNHVAHGWSAFEIEP